MALYYILGVPREASEAEIRRSFRMRALSVHPDKRPNDPEAVNNFQELRRAYDILIDPERRKRYDKSGETEAETDEFKSAYEFFRSQFPRVTQSAIDDFARTYPGSSAEDEDLCHFYNQRQGDMTRLLEYIPLSTPEAVPRLVDRLRKLIDDKRLRVQPEFESSLPQLATQSKKWRRRGREEAKNAAAASESLISAIQSRRRVANENFIADLEAKYAPKRFKLGTK